MKIRIAVGLLVLLCSNLAEAFCPLPPLPPLGCKVGPCVCDQQGQNCQYLMICK